MPAKSRLTASAERLAKRRALRPLQIDANQLYSLSETTAALDCSRAQLYRLLKDKRIHLAEHSLDSRPRILGSELIRVATGGNDSAPATTSPNSAGADRVAA